MIFAESRVWQLAANVAGKRSLRNAAAVVLGALFMAWPAFYNGLPLLYPDSMTYIGDGSPVARAVFLHRFSGYYGMRSFFYSLGILPLHWYATLWPVVAMQCLLVASILWLVVRSFAPLQTLLAYLALVVPLSLFTGMSWYASLVMPDILGPLLYLSIYLLVFARDTLSLAERLALCVFSWWAVTSHATHLMLAVGLCLVLASLFAFRRAGLRRHLRSLLEVAAIVVLAAAAQLTLHGYLYGTPSLNGDRPPFLTARIIADGPGRWYLENHCAQLNWAICSHVHHLSANPDNFLWGDDGIYQNASDSESTRLAQEEIPFALATLRAYPRQQISRSAANFWGQLTSFGFNDLDPSSWVLDQFATVLPGARSTYLKSRQARDDLPLGLFAAIQFWAVMVSLAVIVIFVPLLLRRRSPRIAGLAVVVIFTVVANALVTGALSMVEDRFECRMIWLLPLLAGISVLNWLSSRNRQGKSGSTDGIPAPSGG